MHFGKVTMTRAQLHQALGTAVRYPHGEVRKGRFIISPEAYETPGRQTNLVISRFALIDCTGSIQVGPWCNIGARSRIYTHEHLHAGKRPLLQLTETYGVLWQDKLIGADVWINDGAMVLYQVTCIPDGVVLGAGSILTRNPGPYEIWAGNPARKIGKREETDPKNIERMVSRRGFSLDDRF